MRGEFSLISKNDITLMDRASGQCRCKSRPFLENDDANHALMGANMMRQAVPISACGASGRHRNGASVARDLASPPSRVARK